MGVGASVVAAGAVGAVGAVGTVAVIATDVSAPVKEPPARPAFIAVPTNVAKALLSVVILEDSK